MSSRIPSQKRGTRKIFKSEVAVGCITFLPHRQDLKLHCINDASRNGRLSAEGYNHPTIIVSIYNNDQGETMTLCVMVSHAPKPNKAESIKTGYLPTWTKDQKSKFSLGDSTKQVFYPEKAESLNKPSMINLTHIYEIPLLALRSMPDLSVPFEARLSEESFMALRNEIGLGKPKKCWVPTQRLTEATPVYSHAPEPLPLRNDPDVGSQKSDIAHLLAMSKKIQRGKTTDTWQYNAPCQPYPQLQMPYYQLPSAIYAQQCYQAYADCFPQYPCHGVTM